MQNGKQGMVEVDISALLQASGATGMDLTRFGLAQGTAYKLTKGRTTLVELGTIGLLVDFFRQRLGRNIDLTELMVYTPPSE